MGPYEMNQHTWT